MTTNSYRNPGSSQTINYTTNSDPSLAPGVAAEAGALCARTDVPSIYCHTGPLDTDWTLVGIPGSSGGIAPFFEDFILADAAGQADGWIITVSGPGGTGQIGNTEPTTVGTYELDVLAAPDIASAHLLRDFWRLESGSSKAKIRARANGTPAIGADFNLEIGHIDNAGVPNSVGVYFTAGLALGNSNWWVKLNAVLIDTGILVDNSFHTFRIEFDSISSQWSFYIDDQLVATQAAVGQQNKSLGFTLSGVGAFATLAVADYFFFNTEISR